MQGIINAFDMPGRQSFMVKMVEDRADLSNAIAINSSMVNTARLIGPSLAGSADRGHQRRLVLPRRRRQLHRGHRLAADDAASSGANRSAQRQPCSRNCAKDGRTFQASAPIRTILLLFALLSLMGWPFMVLMPIFAGEVLHGGPHTLGFLMGAVGVGSLASALSMVMRRSVRGLTKMIPIAAAAFGVGLIAFGLSHGLLLSMLMMLVTGFGMMQGLTASNTILQTLVDERMRGRVMSYYTMAFVGMAPFGSLLAGTLAHAIGAPRTVIVSGVACILGALWFWSRLPAIRKDIRPIYERLGIVPPRNVPVEESAES